MRGKALFAHQDAGKRRITPAYAGKSFQLGEVPAVQKDHPRLCGEKESLTVDKTPLAGSPPPMRGKVYSFGDIKDQVGITPAYAGKSSICVKVVSPTRDHPRLCGEKPHLSR